ncbi:UNVERIFIED_CONTAM: hypothetical protein FKN15_035658, partial [Acipenser sinensis]
VNILRLVAVTFGQISTDMYYHTKVMSKLFLESSLSEKDTSNYKSVGSMEDIWTYFEGPLLDGLYWDSWYNNKSLPTNESHIYYENVLLGVPRIRQVKVVNKSCPLHSSFVSITQCFDSYLSEEEDKSSFGPKNGTAWEYTAPRSFPESHWGMIATYSSGGFYMDLGSTKSRSAKLIKHLKDNLWLSRATRAVFVDFSVYNANLNLFCVVRLVAETPATGGVLTSWEFYSVKLLRYISKYDYFLASCEVLFILFIFSFFIQECIDIYKTKWNYFKNGWNCVDVLLVVLSLMAIFFNVYRTINVERLLYRLLKNPHKYPNFHFLAFWQTQYNNMIAVNVFISWVKNMFLAIINDTYAEIKCDQSLQMTDYEVSDFIKKTCNAALVKLRLKKKKLVENTTESIKDTEGVVSVKQFQNMFLAIINDTYAEIKCDQSLQMTDYEVSDFIKKTCSAALVKLRLKKKKLVENTTKSIKDTEGIITVKQFQMEMLKKGYTEEETKEILMKYDVNRDGKLSNKEVDTMTSELENQEYGLAQQHSALKEDNGRRTDSTHGEEGDLLSPPEFVSKQDYQRMVKHVFQLEERIDEITFMNNKLLIQLNSLESITSSESRKKDDWDFGTLIHALAKRTGEKAAQNTVRKLWVVPGRQPPQTQNGWRRDSGSTGRNWKLCYTVMSETNTQIKWPSKLKIGAKSKKDPHVKVEGKKAGVLEAKKKILDVLETKVNKVTLKMDVAHTEHSHVIGKGGSNIKKVMEETGCHIHFPDSNRNNVHLEKSNQVSIAGSLSGVESARRRIRDLQPLVLSFDLPMRMVSHTVPDVNSPVIHHISQAFNINVSFRQQPKLYSTTCLVRGLQGNCVSIQKATAVLMELLLGADPSVSVSTQLELTSQQHVFLMGQNGANFINIMHMTQTQIVFPDLNCPQNRATLLIQGTADAVCLAKQQLQDCLPLCLMFDLKEDAEVEPHKLSQMMQNLGVFISIKPKVKQAAKSVVVKSLERNTVNLYEARRLLLSLETSEVAMAIKPACDIPLTNGLTNYWLNLITQQLSLTDSGPVPSFGAVVNAVLQAKAKPTPPPGLTLQHQADREAQKSDGKKPTEMKKNMLSEAEDLQSTPSIVRPSADTVPECEEPQGMRVDTSRRSSQSEGSKEPWQEGSTAASRQNTALQNLKELLLKCDLGSDYSEKPSSLRKDIIELQETGPDAIKNEVRQMQAMLKKPVETEVRTPTDTWSGLGFSKSMPAEAVKELRCVNRRSYKSYLGNNLQVTSTTDPLTASISIISVGWKRSSNEERVSISGREWSLQESLSKESLASGSDSENWRERRDSASSSSPLSSSSASSFPVFASSSSRSRADKSSESFLSSSNYFDSISSLTCSSNCCSSPTHKQTADLPELFSQLGLGKYIDIFQQQEIDFQTFLTLTDEDLKEVGISTFGARRKMLLAISDFSKSKKKLLDPPTVRPGYLEGGASGRLPRIVDVDIAAQSNRW